MRVCKIDGCDRDYYAKGWCQHHYLRAYRGLPPEPEPRATHRTKVTPRRYV